MLTLFYKRSPKFSFFRSGRTRPWILSATALASATLLSGCFLDRDCIPTACGGPERLVPISQDLALIIANTDYGDVLSRYNSASSLDAKKAIRNEFIFDRLYAMDVKYTAYEENLTRESQSEGFAATVASAALTGTATLIPVAQTARLLSGIATGLNTTDQAYNSQFLYNKTVQILQAQMRAKRAEVASLITFRTNSPVTEYPLGMALTNLEEYYRAGTLSSAFVDLSEKISSDAATNKRVKDQLQGGGAVVTAAQVRGSVISNIDAPLLKPPQTPPNTGPTRLTTYEQRIIPRDMKFVVSLLCHPEASDLGVAGSIVRKDLGKFLMANGKTSQETLDRNAFDNLRDLHDKGNCPQPLP